VCSSDLTPAQVLALDVLDAGGTHSEAAQVAGVHRVTVSKWTTRHPGFVAELTRRRLARFELVADRAEAVTLSALDLVAKAIDNGDTSAALSWLKLAGLPSSLADHRAKVASAPLSAGEMLDREADKLSMAAPLAVMTDSYRPAALEVIAKELEASQP
jgi:hypothetical protein